MFEFDSIPSSEEDFGSIFLIKDGINSVVHNHYKIKIKIKNQKSIELNS